MDKQNLSDYELPEQLNWLKPEEYPVYAKIIKTEPVRGKYGIDIRSVIKLEDGSTRHFDIWGGNLNYLRNVVGTKISSWVDTDIYIQVLEGKKVLSLVLAKT